MICSDGCIHRTVRRSRSDDSPAYRAQQTSLESFVVRRISANQVGHTARQNIAEDPETGPEYGFRLKLPRDRGSRLQNGERCGRKQIAEMSLDGRIQRLIHIMRDRTKRTAKTRDSIVGVERV